MIDVIWLANNAIKMIFEVENTTNFISGIQRGSNLSNDILKIMVIPNYREKELLRIPDPLFVNSFKTHNWKYLLYSDVEKILQSKTNMDTLNLFIKDIGS